MLKLVKKLCVMFVAFCAFWVAQTASAEKYEIDPVHSTIGFAVKHMMVSITRGAFSDYQGTVEFDSKDVAAFKADVVIQAKSINTGAANRDNHLRSAEFLDVEKFPTITFVGKQLQQQGAEYLIIGDLTIHGVTKEITIPVMVSGPVSSPSGTQVIGLSGSTVINRQDFGVSWHKSLDSGGLVVDDMVKIIVEIEAGKK